MQYNIPLSEPFRIWSIKC